MKPMIMTLCTLLGGLCAILRRTGGSQTRPRLFSMRPCGVQGPGRASAGGAAEDSPGQAERSPGLLR